MFLASGGIVVDIETLLGEFKRKRPNRIFVVNVVRLAQNPPEVGKLEIGYLLADEVTGFLVAQERVGTWIGA